MGIPFETGRAKTGGKQKGYKSVKKTVDDILKEKGVDIWQMILDLLPDLRPKDQMQALLEIVQYTAPKQASQSIEISAEVGPSKLALEREMLNRLLANPTALDALKVLENTRLLVDNESENTSENAGSIDENTGPIDTPLTPWEIACGVTRPLATIVPTSNVNEANIVPMPPAILVPSDGK